MVFASLSFAFMGACVYAIGIIEPAVSSPFISFVRIMINFGILLFPTVAFRNFSELIGDGRPSLWLRGLFGSISLMLIYGAIRRIGVGESYFIDSMSAVFIALLGPLILAERNSISVWVAIFGSLFGLFLILDPHMSHSREGEFMALFSSISAALAYLMVARSGRSNAPKTVVFYFCIVGVVVHLLYFLLFGFSVPSKWNSWMLLFFVGVLGSIGQLYMTKAHQIAPAAQKAAVSYIKPVFSLLISVALFSKVPTAKSLIGCVIILLFGVMLPFAKRNK